MMNVGKSLCIVASILLLCLTVSAADIQVGHTPSLSDYLRALNIYGSTWDQYSADEKTVYINAQDSMITFHFASSPSSQLKCTGAYFTPENVKIRADAMLIPYNSNDPNDAAITKELVEGRMNLIWTSKTRVGNVNNVLSTGAYIAEHPWEDYCVASGDPWNPFDFSLQTGSFMVNSGSAASSAGGAYGATVLASKYGTDSLRIAANGENVRHLLMEAGQGAKIGKGIYAGAAIGQAITSYGIISEGSAAAKWLYGCGLTNYGWVPGIKDMGYPVSKSWSEYPKTCDSTVESCYRTISIPTPAVSGLYQDYYAIVSACTGHDTTVASWCLGQSEYICEAYVLPIRVVSAEYCGDAVGYETPIGTWDKSCYNLGIKTTGKYGFYCDANQHKCMDPCGKCDGVCMAEFLLNPSDMKNFANSTSFMCIPQNEYCTTTSDCIQWAQLKGSLVGQGSAAYQKAATRVGNIDAAAQGVHCEKDTGKITNSQITQYNAFAAQKGSIGMLGQCQLGAAKPEDCTAVFGVATDVPAMTVAGTPLRAVGWKVYQPDSVGKCVLDWCAGFGGNCFNDRDMSNVRGSYCLAYNLNDGSLCDSAHLPSNWATVCAGRCVESPTINTATTCASDADCAKQSRCQVDKSFCYCTRTSAGFSVCGPSMDQVSPWYDVSICDKDSDCMYSYNSALKACEKMVCDKSTTGRGQCTVKSGWTCNADSDCAVGEWTGSACDVPSHCCVSQTGRTIPAASCNDHVCNGKETCTMNTLITTPDCGGPDCQPCPIIPVPCDPFGSWTCFYDTYYGMIWLMVGSLVMMVIALFVVYAYQRNWFKKRRVPRPRPPGMYI